MKKLFAFLAIAIFLVGCGDGQSGESPKTGQLSTGSASVTLTIASGSENKELEPILETFVKEKNINLNMEYMGSLEIKSLLESSSKYDAVWPASSLWISMGDVNHRVKHLESTTVTPVVFGIRKSLAEELGFVGREVSITDITDAIASGKLKFSMTSATQSNSGASAYLSFLSALAGNPEVLTSENLKDPALKQKITELLSGVDRSSGSSEWLKTLFLAGNYDAMVNYESLIITTNEELVKAGRKPLYVIYPYDGLAISDSPLGYIDSGDAKKEEAFLALSEYLLSEPVQNEMQKLGRRTGFAGVNAENQAVFNADWGIDTKRVLSPMTTPKAEVIEEALALYQQEFKKPGFTVFVTDFSGSMDWEGRQQLLGAMKEILIQDHAKMNLLQANEEEINYIIPFNQAPITIEKATGNVEIENLYDTLNGIPADGGTDLYLALIEALKILREAELAGYSPMVIAMTDGRSETYNAREFYKQYEEAGLDIPVFSIVFGDADPKQLEELGQKTRARVFDGRKDLIDAFKKVKGYN